jgi:hypothetical protein
VLAELLERRGAEEALAEARTLRDGVTQHLARHEARRAAALEETRAEAAKAVRQWREERSRTRGEKNEGGKAKAKAKKKGKAKKKKGRKAQGKGPSAAPAIEGEPPREPAGGEAGWAAAAEGAAAAGAQQLSAVKESSRSDAEDKEKDDEEGKEECAICLQDLELEDNEDPWGDEEGEGEALVVLKCGHRFHRICGDMWCAKCADKGWGVTCPGCRAPYVMVQGREGSAASIYT